MNKLLVPDVFLSATWLSTTIFYYLFATSFTELELIYFLHLVVFLFFFSITYRITSKVISTSKVKSIKPFLNTTPIYIIAVLAFLYVVYNLYSIINIGVVTSAMELRTNIAGDEKTASSGIGIAFPFVCLAYYLATKNQQVFYSKFFLVLTLIVAVLSTAKIFLIITLTYWLALNKSKLNLIKVLAFIAIGLTTFGLSHIILEKYSSNPEDGLMQALINTFSVYMFGSIAALQNLLQGQAVLEPNIMFYGLKRFGGDYFINIPESSILPWTRVGVWHTNVYTAFGYWFAFFGHYFSVFMSIALGLYYGLFFNKNKFIIRTFGFYATFLLFTLFFTLFGDQYIPALSMHIGFLAASMLFCITKKLD